LARKSTVLGKITQCNGDYCVLMCDCR